MFCCSCGKELLSDAGVCPSCGCDPKGGCKFCQVCGAAIADGASFCGSCGTAIRKGGGSLSFGAIAKRHWKIIVGIALVVWTIIACVIDGGRLDETGVSETIVKMVNEHLSEIALKTYDAWSGSPYAGIKATEVTCLDLEKKGKRWLGTANVKFSREERSHILTMTVEVSPTKKDGEIWVQAHFTDKEAADHTLRNL